MTKHCYIYYPLRDRLAADFLRDLIIQEFPKAEVSDLNDKLVEDHPLPMFSAKLSSDDISRFQQWITQRRGDFSVRIDLADESIWLGRKL